MSSASSIAATYGSVFSLVLSDSTSSLLTHESSCFSTYKNHNNYSSQSIDSYAANPTDPIPNYIYTSIQDSIDAHGARMKSYLGEFDRVMALHGEQDFQSHNNNNNDHSIRKGRDVLDCKSALLSSDIELRMEDSDCNRPPNYPQLIFENAGARAQEIFPRKGWKSTKS